MLFDLKGRRRRVVQATYLALAVLMGGGLVLFGIGGDVQGGLFDAFSERGSSGAGSGASDQVEKAEERLRANPRDRSALEDLIRGNYQLAAEEADPNTGTFGPEAMEELRATAAAWERYLDAYPDKPDPALATRMVQVYGEGGLKKPAEAAAAAETVANARPTPQAFLQLMQYASLAGQKRKADLAAERAIELAPRGQRQNVREAVKQARAAAASAGGGAGAQPRP